MGRFCISGAIFRGSVLNFWCDFSWVGFEFLVRFFVGRFCISGAIFCGSVLHFWCDFSWVGFEFLVRFFVGRYCISGAIFFQPHVARWAPERQQASRSTNFWCKFLCVAWCYFLKTYDDFSIVPVLPDQKKIICVSLWWVGSSPCDFFPILVLFLVRFFVGRF